MSVAVTNRHARSNGRFGDYARAELSICTRGANVAAVVTDVWQERRLSSVRLRYDFDHPRETRMFFVQNGEVLATPRVVTHLGSQ